MTELEVVGLWISVGAGFVSIALALTAMAFTWRVNNQHHELNRRFTETLTSINEQSSITQWQISNMLRGVVDTLLAFRSGQETNTGITVNTGDHEEGEGTVAILNSLGILRRDIEELKLRQRVQPITAADFDSPSNPSFEDLLGKIRHVGERVRILESYTEAELRGKIGSVERISSYRFPGMYQVRIDGSVGLLRPISGDHLEPAGTLAT